MLLTLIISLVLIFICVAIHYEALYRFGSICQALKIRGRMTVAAGSIWALVAHTMQVWLFGTTYYFFAKNSPSNSIVSPTGEEFHGFMDAIYFSFITYTSLGYGDLVPEGPIRFMAGAEALVGLVFIAWTASFLYLKMEHNWREVD